MDEYLQFIIVIITLVILEMSYFPVEHYELVSHWFVLSCLQTLVSSKKNKDFSELNWISTNQDERYG